jgi:hypothetical protein
LKGCFEIKKEKGKKKKKMSIDTKTNIFLLYTLPKNKDNTVSHNRCRGLAFGQSGKCKEHGEPKHNYFFKIK